MFKIESHSSFSRYVAFALPLLARHKGQRRPHSPHVRAPPPPPTLSLSQPGAPPPLPSRWLSSPPAALLPSYPGGGTVAGARGDAVAGAHGGPVLRPVVAPMLAARGGCGGRGRDPAVGGEIQRCSSLPSLAHGSGGQRPDLGGKRSDLYDGQPDLDDRRLDLAAGSQISVVGGQISTTEGQIPVVR